ncbi:subtilisin SUB8 [Cardiosporidium cionae]|uniref:subtilisin n=1 Tax=Cardiosporidium cionae TaxID=476202 RepID=A0ABQ7JDZ8_9APIC|nr:subtilisin SUB8 [Cardiosporidium cionae]|eukprot:KAF8822211.1 subtilisin SUB8 [Cardiosporidium cionae]
MLHAPHEFSAQGYSLENQAAALESDLLSRTDVEVSSAKEKIPARDGLQNASSQNDEDASTHSINYPNLFDGVHATKESANLTHFPWDSMLDEIYPNRLLIGWQCTNDDILNGYNEQQRRQLKNYHENTTSNHFSETGTGSSSKHTETQRELQFPQSVAPFTIPSPILPRPSIFNCPQLNDPNCSIVMNATSCDEYTALRPEVTTKLYPTLDASSTTFVVFERLRQLFIEKQKMHSNIEWNTAPTKERIDSSATENLLAKNTRAKLRETIKNWFDKDTVKYVRRLYKRKQSHIPFKIEKTHNEQEKKIDKSRKNETKGVSPMDYESSRNELLEKISNTSMPFFQTSEQGITICEIDLIHLKLQNESKKFGNGFCSNICECQQKKRNAALSMEFTSSDVMEEIQKLDEEKKVYLRVLKSFVAEFSQAHYSDNIAFIIPDAPICLSAFRNGPSGNLSHNRGIKNSQPQSSTPNFNDLPHVGEKALPIIQAPDSDKLEKKEIPLPENERLSRNSEKENVASDGNITSEYQNSSDPLSPRNTKGNSNKIMAEQHSFRTETTQAAESNSKTRPTFLGSISFTPDTITSPPNDPLFNLQWALRPFSSSIEAQSSQSCIQTAKLETNALSLSNSKVKDFCEGITGQSASKQRKDAAIGIDALSAWEIERRLLLKGSTHKARNIVPVAIIDTGVNYFHQDIQGSMWINEAELFGKPNVDDDNNGYIDDVYGWNFFHENNNPMDDNGHGTHISGIVAARRDNGEGISGICSSSRIMSLKILDRKGEGDISKAIPAIQYALDNGARIITNSWGGIPGSNSRLLGTFLQQIIDVSNPSIFVVAAGNDGLDITNEPYYPASLLRDWTLTVGAYAMDGSIPAWSNYGSANVHFTAPGENITSLWLNQHYRLSSGTSMAAPMASGVACLILARKPLLRPQQVVDALLETITPVPTHVGLSISSGRLNAYQALRFSDFHFFSLSDEAFAIKKSKMYRIEPTNPNLPNTFDNNLQDFSVQSIVVDIQTDDLPIGKYYGYIELSYLKAAESSANIERIRVVVQIRIPVSLSIIA